MTKAWPGRFMYVCSASQAAIVNVLPIIHAGVQRIAKVVVLCGADNMASNDPRLRREAVEPARRLQRFVTAQKDRSGRAPEVTILHGDPTRLDIWTRHLRDVCSEAKAKNLDVVYNLTGGTKPMSIGALLGRQGRVSLVYVAGAPLRVEFIVGQTQVEAARHGEVTRDLYLEAYGMRERAAGERRSLESFYVSHEDGIRAFADTILTNRPNILIPELLKATKSFEMLDRGTFNPGFVRLGNLNGRAAGTLQTAFGYLRGLPGLRLDAKGIRVETKRAAVLLRGGWLEAALFLALRGACKDRNDVDVAANVKLQFTSTRDSRATSEIGELDVTVMASGQLHAIEAKTGSFGKKSQVRTERSLAQVEAHKRNLLGQFGRYILVNPRETEASLRNAWGNFPTRARHAGIDLALGPGAIKLTVALVRALL